MASSQFAALAASNFELLISVTTPISRSCAFQGSITFTAASCTRSRTSLLGNLTDSSGYVHARSPARMTIPGEFALPDDDPATVERMVHCFHTHEYSDEADSTSGTLDPTSDFQKP
ncbi:MAG: hypothetical protein ALECFALPRED_000528 [Alectoria fallacina]|uniref:Uncharacterized protein n=1 Tax=Alectoria fallacina TaxID=1903189 RepID=A0A8H3J9X2_9LECA|nr:MAG: hypothetical protein ALECFALPRED_000528 [Alectoria fallacina]